MKNNKMFIHLTNGAFNKIKNLINKKEDINLKLRVYIIGGGCGGFQYGFMLDNKMSDDDYVIEKYGFAVLVIDPMSLQYLMGGVIDYFEGLDGSRFVVTNPNAKTTCSCGSSFSI